MALPRAALVEVTPIRANKISQTMLKQKIKVPLEERKFIVMSEPGYFWRKDDKS